MYQIYFHQRFTSRFSYVRNPKTSLVHTGKYCTRWRGLSMMKDCCDMVIYQQLIWEVKPKTIIETGAYTGACALWMADTAKIYGIDTRVFSIDIDLSMVEKLAVDDPNVDIRQGDVKQIAKSFPPEMLKVFASNIPQLESLLHK